MRRAAFLTRLALVLALAASLLAACGGGGDDAGPTGPGAPVFEGAYGFLLVEWAQADGYVRSTVGAVTPDGAGELTLETIRSTQAGTDKTAAIAPLTYVEDASGGVVITDRTGRRFVADVSADGSLLAATLRENGVQPALMVLARRAAGTTLAALAGDWMEVAWGMDTASGPVTGIGDYALAFDEALDAAGNAFIDGGHELRLGAYSFVPAIGGSTTTVELRPGGEIAWLRPFDGLTTHVGRLSSDGNLMLLGGEYASQATAATICVRRGQPTSAAELAGTYRANGMGSALLGHYGRWGATTFDGSGGGSTSFASNVEGTVIGPGSATFSYTLDAEGRLSVLWGDDDVPFHGIVGAGGAYVILAGGFENGADAALQVLLR